MEWLQNIKDTFKSAVNITESVTSKDPNRDVHVGGAPSTESSDLSSSEGLNWKSILKWGALALVSFFTFGKFGGKMTGWLSGLAGHKVAGGMGESLAKLFGGAGGRVLGTAIGVGTLSLAFNAVSGMLGFDNDKKHQPAPEIAGIKDEMNGSAAKREARTKDGTSLEFDRSADGTTANVTDTVTPPKGDNAPAYESRDLG